MIIRKYHLFILQKQIYIIFLIVNKNYKNMKKCWKVIWFNVSSWNHLVNYHYTYIGALFNEFILRHFDTAEDIKIQKVED